MRIALLLTLLASAEFSGYMACRHKVMIQRGLYFVAPQTTCDSISACQYPVDLHQFNSMFPRCLHWMICPGGKRG